MRTHVTLVMFQAVAVYTSQGLIQDMLTSLAEQNEVNCSSNSQSDLYEESSLNANKVEKLLDCPGVDVNHVDELMGETPLHAACHMGEPEIVRVLLSRPDIDVNAVDDDGMTPLMIVVCDEFDLEIVRLLLGRPDVDINRVAPETGETALLTAFCLGADSITTDIVREILAYPGVDVAAVDSVGRSALYMAAEQAGGAEIVGMLLQRPETEVNAAKFSYGDTPLWIASFRGNGGNVRLLLGHPDIDVNRVTDESRGGTSPLLMACQEGHAEVVRLLLSHPDTDVNLATTDEGFAPLMAASLHPDVAQQLLAHPDLDVNQGRLGSGGTALHLLASEDGGEANARVAKLLLAHPDIDVNLGRSDGTTALWLAAFVGNRGVVKRLLDHPGIDVNKAKEDGVTPLHAACHAGGGDPATQAEIVRLLLSHPDTDVNRPATARGNTPLMTASMYHRNEVVRLLLRCPRVDLDARDKGFAGTADYYAEYNPNNVDLETALQTLVILHSRQTLVESEPPTCSPMPGSHKGSNSRSSTSSSLSVSSSACSLTMFSVLQLLNPFLSFVILPKKY